MEPNMTIMYTLYMHGFVVFDGTIISWYAATLVDENHECNEESLYTQRL